MGRFFKDVLPALALVASASNAQAFDLGELYATTRGWEVFQSDMYGCKALSPPGSDVLVIMSLVPAGNFELVLPTERADESESPVLIGIDGQEFRDEFIVFEGNAHGVFEAPLREAMAAGNDMYVSFDSYQRLHQPLAGSKAALLKLQDCWYDLIKPSPKTNRALPVALPSLGAPERGGAPVAGQVQAAPPSSCLPRNGVASPDVQDWGDITFENRAEVPVTIYWIDWRGDGKETAFLRPGESVFVQSRASHLFYALDALGNCHGDMIEVPLGNTTHVIE